MLKPEQFTTLERKIERFSQILKEKPGDELIVLALAEASFRRGLKLEALTAYQVVTSEKAIPEAHLAVAEIYSQQNMTTEAYGELRKLFEVEPDNIEARLLANALRKQGPPPEDIALLLNQPSTDEAFMEAKLRLQIQRAIHNREHQERTRNVTLEPGGVIHEYYVEEAMKKLLEVDVWLKDLEELRLSNETLRALPHPGAVAADAVVAAEELVAAQSADSIEHVAEQPADSEELVAAQPADSLEHVVPTVEVPESPAMPVMDPVAAQELPGPVVDLDGPVEELLVPNLELENVEVPLPEPVILIEDPEILAPSVELDVEPSVPVQDPVTTAVFESPISETSTEEPVEVLAIPVEHLPAEPSEVAVEPEVVADLVGSMELESRPEAESELPAQSAEGETAELAVLPISAQPADAIQDFEPPSLEALPLLSEESGAVDAALQPLTEDVAPGEPQVEVPAAGDSFDMNFAIGVDSPVAPDLPGEDFHVEPPGILDLKPVEMGEELPMPTMDSSPTSSVPAIAVPAIDPVSVSVELPTEELTTLPTVPKAPEERPAPVLSTSVTPEASTPSPPASAAARQAFYKSKAEELGKLTGTLARTRGVTSIFLVARDGTTIDSVVKDNITEERVGELVCESFDFLLAYAKSPSYWVLECSGGIFVMQTLDDDHVLIAIGQAGANFGALRYTMDKTKTKFGAILQDAPR